MDDKWTSDGDKLPVGRSERSSGVPLPCPFAVACQKRAKTRALPAAARATRRDGHSAVPYLSLASCSFACFALLACPAPHSLLVPWWLVPLCVPIGSLLSDTTAHCLRGGPAGRLVGELWPRRPQRTPRGHLARLSRRSHRTLRLPLSLSWRRGRGRLAVNGITS